MRKSNMDYLVAVEVLPQEEQIFNVETITNQRGFWRPQEEFSHVETDYGDYDSTEDALMYWEGDEAVKGVTVQVDGNILVVFNPCTVLTFLDGYEILKYFDTPAEATKYQNSITQRYMPKHLEG